MKPIRLTALLMAITAPWLVAADSPSDAKTYALVIGISRYPKLPQDLWLQYPEADAKAFSDHLSSPRGGSVPADRMLVLTNDRATTASIRECIPDVSQERPRQE